MIPAGTNNTDTTRDDVNDDAGTEGVEEDPFDDADLEAIVDGALDDGESAGDTDDDTEIVDGVDTALDEGDEGQGSETQDGTQPRDEQGKFAPKDPKDAANAAAPAKDAAKAGTAGGTAAVDPKDTKNNTAAAAAPKWEALSVNADKEAVAIEEAIVSRANGHVFIAVPEDKFARFQQRIARGVVGERMWRQLDQGLRELEARKTAPPAPSDAEIEASMTLAAIKPFLAELLDEKDVELLTANIKIAQREARDTYAQAEQTRVSQASAPQWEEVQVNALAEQMMGVIRNSPDLKDLTPKDIEEVYTQEFLPFRNSLVFKEGEQTFANTELMYGRLKARAAAVQARSTTATPAPSTAPAKAGHPSTTAPKGAAQSADRFNRGVDAAARTTSVKANRTTRPASGATRAPARAAAEQPRNPQHEAEDAMRKSQRNWLNSDSLELEDSEEL